MDRPPPSPTRRGCLRRTLVWIVSPSAILLLVALVIVALYLRSDDFQLRVGQVATLAVHQATGEVLQPGRFEVSWFPPALSLYQTRLVHAGTDETIVDLPYARVPVDFWNLGAGAIEIEHPTVILHLDADGLREFRGRTPNPNAKPLKRLPLRSLRIEDLVVDLVTPEGRVHAELDLAPVGGPLHTLNGAILVKHADFEETLPLRVDGLQLGPKVIEIPALQLSGEALQVDARASIPLAGPVDLQATADLHLDQLTGLLPPPRDLHGEVHLDLTARGRPTLVEATVTAVGLGADLPGKATPLLTYELGDLAATVQYRETLDIDALTWSWAEGQIQAAGIIDVPGKRLVEGHVYGNGLQLRQILMALDVAPNPWIDLRAIAEVEVHGGLAPLALAGDFLLETQELRVTNQPVHLATSSRMLDIERARARGTLFLGPRHIDLHAPWIRGPVTKGAADVSIGFGAQGPLDARLDAWGAHLGDFQPLGGVELGGDGPIKGRIWGPFNRLQFEGGGEIANFSVLGLPFADRLVAPVFRSPDMKTLEIEGATASVGRSVYTGDFGMDFRPPMSMHADLTVKEGRLEDITGIFVDLEGIEGDLAGHLTFEGPLQAMNADADFHFGATRIWGEHFDRGHAIGRMRDGVFVLEQGRLERQAGAELLDLTGTVQGAWELDMQLETTGLRLERLDALEGQPVQGDVRLSTRFGNTLFVPDPEGALTIRNLAVAGRPLPDSEARFTSAQGLLSLDADLLGEAVDATGTVPLYQDLPYLVRAQLHEVPAHLFYPVAVDGTPIRAVASGSMQLAGKVAEGWPPRSLFADLEQVEVEWDAHHLQNRNPWAIRLDDGIWALEKLDLAGGKTELDLTGTLAEHAELTGGGVVDLDLLRAVTPGLLRADGTANVTVRTRPEPGGLETRVDVDVDASLIRHSSAPPALEDVTAHLVLRQDRFEIDKVLGSVGGGTLKGGGTLQARGWFPTRYDLAATVENAQVQWVETLPPAIGDARFVFDGPADALLLWGQVDIAEMVFADRIDWEDWVVEYRQDVVVDNARGSAGDGLFDLDVRIQADNTVRLHNNLAEGRARAELRLLGDTNRPGLLGEIRVDDALVFLQDREFRVDRGVITYRDPWTWNPDVDFELLTDVKSRDQRYRIAYQVYGPFSDWRTSSRSEPALPQADVNALLWFGVTTEDLQNAGELPTAVAQGVADLLITDLFASTQASELGEVPELFFDSIDVATGVNGRGEYSAEPRLVVRKRLEEFGEVELMWEFNLGRPEDNYVRIDKRIGDVWNIAGWYATLQRDRVLPIGGAYGFDLAARWEIQ